MPETAKRSEKTKRTLRLSQELIQTAQEAVALGLASTTTAFVEDAVRSRTREVRHARMRLLAAEAVADPGFLEDMRATTSAFAPFSGDGWPVESGSATKRTAELPNRTSPAPLP